MAILTRALGGRIEEMVGREELLHLRFEANPRDDNRLRRSQIFIGARGTFARQLRGSDIRV